MISEYQPLPCSFNQVLIEIGRWTFNYQYYEIHDLYISSDWIKFLPPVLHLITKESCIFFTVGSFKNSSTAYQRIVNIFSLHL